MLPAFRLLFLPPRNAGRTFFCAQRDLPARPCSFTRSAVSKAVIAVVERPGVRAVLCAFFGAGAISGDGAPCVDCGEGELLFVTHEGLQRLYPDLDLPRYAAPWTAAMRIGVLILADAADYLDYKEVKFTTTALGMAVLPDQTNGTIVEFVADAD